MKQRSIQGETFRLHEFDAALPGTLHFKNVTAVGALLDKHDRLCREIDAVLAGKPLLATKYQEIYYERRKQIRADIIRALHIPLR